MRTKSWTLRCPDWSPHVPVGDQGARVEAVAAGVQPDRGGRAGRLQPHAVVNWAKAGGRRPAAPQGRPYTCPSTGRWSSSRGWRPGSGPPTSPPRPASPPLPSPAAPAAPRGRGASLMTDSDIAARAPEPREAPSELEELRARLRGAGAAQRRPRGDDRLTKKRPRAPTCPP